MSFLSRLKSPAGLLWLAVLLVVGLRLARFIGNGWFAVRYPYELDFGEGIVWQQAVMLLDGSAYGDITRYPFIVFHYTPIFHLLADGMDALMPGDWLAAGRLVSLLSALVAAALCMWFVRLATDRDDQRWAGALFALVLFVSAAPIVFWTGLARVDMPALAFGLGGLIAGISALKNPKRIALAALLFVLALFTRQTAIFAPAAFFGLLLLARPRLAVAGIGWSLAFGLAGLALMVALTDGRFLDHIFLYNVNRFELKHFVRLTRFGLGSQLHFPVLAAAAALFLILSGVRSAKGHDWRGRLAATPSAFATALAVAYLLASLPSFALAAKLGSNVNYFIDFSTASAIVVGIAAARWPARRIADRALRPVAVLFPLLIVAAAAAFTIPAVYAVQASIRPSIAVLDADVRLIRSSPKPVISDDMVLLRKAGRYVPWESAIFTELAHAGMWDENLIIRMIDARRFAFIRTTGMRGMPAYDQRYRPAIKRAIERSYPFTRREGIFVNNFPTDPDARAAAVEAR